MLPGLGDAVDATLANDGTTGKLNESCGADFVKSNQAAPGGMALTDGVQCASFDGDADRLMFFYTRDGGKFRMLDGDRIAVLCAVFLKERIAAAGLELNLGCVQTAYANGGSTAHLDGLKIPVACAKTGVKHLHHLALNYDVGVYFEANGQCPLPLS
jgi:phosphoacetylglucosamine mutase